AIARLLADPQLRARIARGGRRTAQYHAWERRIDELEAFLYAIADGAPERMVRGPRRSVAPRG
ncbi:MAG: hypothetical protein ACRDLN_12380, partial [Solirubrobacteraceae bacterium]